MDKKIHIASDHNGNAARAYVCRTLDFLQLDYVDHGPTEEQGKVDYPDFAAKVSLAVACDQNSLGILICGTGTGMCIAANKFTGVRAGLGTDTATAKLMREHNNSNVLVLGQWRNSLSQIEDIVVAFIDASYLGGRHDARLLKLEKIDQGIF